LTRKIERALAYVTLCCEISERYEERHYLGITAIKNGDIVCGLPYLIGYIQSMPFWSQASSFSLPVNKDTFSLWLPTICSHRATCTSLSRPEANNNVFKKKSPEITVFRKLSRCRLSAGVTGKLVLGSLYVGYVRKADHSPLLVQTSRQWLINWLAGYDGSVSSSWSQ
jgi:hypothetical protein